VVAAPAAVSALLLLLSSSPQAAATTSTAAAITPRTLRLMTHPSNDRISMGTVRYRVVSLRRVVCERCISIL
jgi:hypothetical protein